jgi:hypothetical protein
MTENLTSLAAKIIFSSPQEGTDEENECYDESSKFVSTKKYHTKFVKDRNTGIFEKIQVAEETETKKVIYDLMECNGTSNYYMADDDTAPNSHPIIKRKRGLGPRLCGTCLCDKRSISISAVYVSKKISSSKRTKFQSRSVIDVLGNTKFSNQNTVISIATHCPFCNCCVVDVDHHCSYLG